MTACGCVCHSNGAFPPPCPQPGGCGPHDTHAGSAVCDRDDHRCNVAAAACAVVPRCHRGAGCHDREVWQVGDRHKLTLGAPSDRPLCAGCERLVANTLHDAPALYVQLRTATLVRDVGAQHGEKVTKSAGSPMPLNSRALDLTEQLHWLLTTWEDEVRSIAGLSARSRRPFDEWERTRGQAREGSEVQDAARLLSAYVTAWVAAPATVLATSRWTDDLEQSGAQAARALLDWRSAVRNLPGLDVKAPKAVKRYEQRCPACGVRAITHRAGDDLMHCQSCGATQEYMPTLPREADYREGSAA